MATQDDPAPAPAPAQDNITRVLDDPAYDDTQCIRVVFPTTAQSFGYIARNPDKHDYARLYMGWDMRATDGWEGECDMIDMPPEDLRNLATPDSLRIMRAATTVPTQLAVSIPETTLVPVSITATLVQSEDRRQRVVRVVKAATMHGHRTVMQTSEFTLVAWEILVQILQHQDQ